MASGNYVGYVHQMLEENWSLRDFMLNIARQFGYAISQKDDGPGPIRRSYEVDSYYAEAVEEAEKEVAKLKAMPEEERVQFGKDYLAGQLEYHGKQIATAKEELIKIEEMLKKVQSWEPPTEECAPLRDNALDMLNGAVEDAERSIQWGQRELYKKRLADVPAEIFYRQLESAERDLASAIDELKDAKDRAKKANEWAEALYRAFDQRSQQA